MKREGTTTCFQNVVEGERIKLSLKREKTLLYVWPSTCFFPTMENTFRFIGPFQSGATLKKICLFCGLLFYLGQMEENVAKSTIEI
jgi:hypothetical protein